MCTVVYISPKFALHKLYLFLYLVLMLLQGAPKLQSLVYIKAALLALKYKRHRTSDYTYPNIWQNGLSPGNIICNWSWYTATDILVIKGDINHVFYLKQLFFLIPWNTCFKIITMILMWRMASVSSLVAPHVCSGSMLVWCAAMERWIALRQLHPRTEAADWLSFAQRHLTKLLISDRLLRQLNSVS